MKCKGCGESFKPTRKGQSLCKFECFKLYQQKQFIKNAKKERKEYYEKNKTITQIKNEVKKIFQKWVRMRDKDKPCKACGNPKGKEWHGSHFKKAEIYSGVIFDERNCHKCCDKCNVFLNGNELMFREGLVAEFGEKWVKQLEKDANKTRDYKWTRDELTAISNNYKLKIKELQNGSN